VPVADRIIEVATAGARVRVDASRLAITVGGETVDAIPLDEVAALVLATPAISLTHRALAELASRGVNVVISDGRRMPAAMLVPISAHSLHAERLRIQVEAPRPRRKRIWQSIVQAKLRAQAAVLEEVTGSDRGLRAMARRVRSGDPDNLEAQAARRYWPALFGEAFRRQRDGGGVNPVLNYGYAVLRSVVARALCGVGLHPSLGVHHHGRYDAFSLASDAMEPFRPWVDLVVAVRWADEPPEELTPEVKRTLLAPLLARYEVDRETRTLFDLAARVAGSLVEALATGRVSLPYPEAPAVGR